MCVYIVLNVLCSLIVYHHRAVLLCWYMVYSILYACSITDEARFFRPPSGPLSSKEWRLLTSSDRLQPIKCVRYHPLITATTPARNRPGQATAVDVKLTQIHQDEFPFFTSFFPALINRGLSLNRIIFHIDSQWDGHCWVSMHVYSVFVHI